MVGAERLPPAIIEYPLLMTWWPPSIAVAFLAFGGDVRLLRSRSIDRLWEHGPLSRMLGVEDEHAEPIRAAAFRLERELKRGSVEARAAPQRAYMMAGKKPGRGRPSYVDIAPKAWGSLVAKAGGSPGLSVLLDDIEVDVLTSNKVPVLWNWEVRRTDVMRLPIDDSASAAQLAAACNALTEVPFRVAHILRELAATGVKPPPLKKDRVAMVRAYYRDRYRGGVGTRTVEETMKKLANSEANSDWF